MFLVYILVVFVKGLITKVTYFDNSILLKMERSFTSNPQADKPVAAIASIMANYNIDYRLVVFKIIARFIKLIIKSLDCMSFMVVEFNSIILQDKHLCFIHMVTSNY